MTGPAAAAAGDNVTYTLTVTNNGPDTANGVLILDFLGTDQYVSATSNGLACGTQNASVACWVASGFDPSGEPQIAPLASGASATVDLTVKIFSGAHTNRATATAQEADPNNANSNASVTTTTPAAPLTFVVTNTLDSDPDEFGRVATGSLRRAIIDSNSNVGPSGSPNTIRFNIPGPGPFTIAPAFPFGALPTISVPVVIDGTTQPGFSGTPIIELSGANNGGTGLSIQTSGSTVRGLVINRWNTGISLGTSTVGGNTIVGNYIGTNVAGTAAAAPTQFRGMQVNSPNNIIGGTTAADRNVISGNGGGNAILVSAQLNGTTVVTSGAGTIIRGNYIGPQADGNSTLGNLSNGIQIQAPNVIVGGTTTGERNVIGPNSSTGIVVNAQVATGTATVLSTGAGSVIQGNYIGVKADGSGGFGLTQAIGVDVRA
jgi:uncharacterized repeat protein (TIGR01451 family)